MRNRSRKGQFQSARAAGKTPKTSRSERSRRTKWRRGVTVYTSTVTGKIVTAAYARRYPHLTMANRGHR